MNNFQDLDGKIETAIHTLYDFRQQNQRFQISNSEGTHLITASEILFGRSVAGDLKQDKNPNQFEFQLTDGRSIQVSKADVSHYEHILAPLLFARISKSCLINLLYIKSLNKTTGLITMKSCSNQSSQSIETKFSISKIYRSGLLKLYHSIIEKQAKQS